MNNLSINTIAECNTYDELRTFIKREDINIKNLLVGNGYSRAHPIFKNAFKWNLEKALSSQWCNLCPDKYASRACPEADLEIIRSGILKSIIYFYINKFLEALPPTDEACSCNDPDNRFCSIYNRYSKSENLFTSILFDGELQLFDNIFTINYDPLMYFDFLYNNQKGNRRYVDGFCGMRPIDQNDILDHLNQTKDKGKIIFLHGSWFIITDENHQLRKLTFSKRNCIEEISKYFTYPNVPYLVLEDRYEVKEMILNSEDPKNIYLKGSFDLLKKFNSGNILILGCSFNKDLHLLEALINNMNIKNIYFGYVDDGYLRELEKKLSFLYGNGQSPRDYSALHGVKLGDNVIWKKLP